MELVTSNAQGELSPLEIGLHALRCESLAKGGRGKKGGLTEYAEKIGRSQPYVSQVRNAAEVLGEAKPITWVMGLLDKAKHLSAIHAMPKPCWPGCVEWLAKNDVSKDKVVERVKAAKEFLKAFEVPKEWKRYLPPNLCAVGVFSRTRPQTSSRACGFSCAHAQKESYHGEIHTNCVAYLANHVRGSK